MLVLGIVVIILKANTLTGSISKGALVTINLEEANYDKNKLASSVKKIDNSADIHYLDDINKVDIFTNSKEKADEIFNTVKTDFSLKAEKADISGNIAFKVFNFDLRSCLIMIVVCIVFSFIAMIPFLGVKYGIANAVSNIFNIVLIFAMFLLFNLQLNISFISMIIISIVILFYFDISNSIIIEAQMKKMKKVILDDVMNYLYQDTTTNNIIVKLILLCTALVLAFMFPVLRVYMLIAFIILLLSLYSSYFLTNSLWLKLKENKASK